MMKISKPALTNDFMLSSVQFTSLNSIVFKNVKNVYDVNGKILLEYEHSPKIEASSRDWIGIFPRGWSTLQQYITFEWVSHFVPCGNNEQNKENGDLVRRAINFCPKYHMGSINSNSLYQFVYVSKQIEVLGVSSYFRFDLTFPNDTTLELECLVPVSSKLRSSSVSDFGILMANNISSQTSIDTRTLHTTSIHSLQNLESEGKSWAKPQIPLSVSDIKKSSIFPRKSTRTGDALDPYSSHSEPVFPMSFQATQCKKCFHFKRGGEFLRSQQVLQSKVGPRSEEASEFIGQRRTLGREILSEDKLKIVMERNKVLEERTQEMKKEMERLQAESKRFKTSFYNINKEKVAYEKFVKDFIKSLEKDSIVRVVNGNTEILVKKVNYVGMEEHPRDKKTSKRERELKAVIGLQEITIRNLINSLQEKAKSVQDLNQTVKLAQAFSAATEDSREFGSDAEETSDEVSNSDTASEYEFSLTKPPPPEEVTVDDTEAVLDDIRRTTEMELKDIGISRSLGKSSSRDSVSELGLPNLSVRSYQNQNEATRPKKPRLFDNVEDCWPFSENTPKVVHRKVIETNIEDRGKDADELDASDSKEETISNDDSNNPEVTTLQEPNSHKDIASQMDGDHTTYENYYDAYEAFNNIFSSKDSNGSNKQPETSEMAVFQEKSGNGEEHRKNFLVTAIIPQDLNLKPAKNIDDWMKMEKDETQEKKQETIPEKGKKFTCQLSIDFAAKVRQTHERTDSPQPAIEGGTLEETQNQICNSFDVTPSETQINREKSLTFKQSNKCLEIKITQVDKKDNVSKNFHQKMVVQFGKDSHPQGDVTRSQKFEFNLAVTGLGDKGTGKPDSELPQLKPFPEETDMETSPRTVWNDAAEDVLEEDASMSETASHDSPPPEEVVEEIIEEVDRESETPEDSKEASEGNSSDMKLYQDSLRYEKNLEFLQQKTEEKTDTEEEVTKDKPTAILIQNGQTKLALIRYQ